jgi:hypothetical protein
MSSQGAMAAGPFLNNAKETNLDKILAPMNTTSLGPRPFHLQELASPKDVQTRTLAYSTRDLYMKNWTLIESRFESHQMDNIVARQFF